MIWWYDNYSVFDAKDSKLCLIYTEYTIPQKPVRTQSHVFNVVVNIKWIANLTLEVVEIA